MKNKLKAQKDPVALSIRLQPHIHDLLIKFQGDYQSETKERVSQSWVVNRALETYITKAYQLSKE